MSEQLEFDLWVEERFSAIDIIRQTPAYARYSELRYARACIYGTSETLVYNDPASLDTVVRYRV